MTLSQQLKEGLKKCGFIHIWVGGSVKMRTKSTKKFKKHALKVCFRSVHNVILDKLFFIQGGSWYPPSL